MQAVAHPVPRPGTSVVDIPLQPKDLVGVRPRSEVSLCVKEALLQFLFVGRDDLGQAAAVVQQEQRLNPGVIPQGVKRFASDGEWRSNCTVSGAHQLLQKPRREIQKFNRPAELSLNDRMEAGAGKGLSDISGGLIKLNQGRDEGQQFLTAYVYMLYAVHYAMYAGHAA